MNGKMYWVLRKTIQNIVFRVKKLIYCLIDCTTGIIEYKDYISVELMIRLYLIRV